MRLLIEIPDEMYKTVQDGTYCGSLYEELKNGIPHETVTEFADRCRECGREKVLDKIRAEIDENISHYEHFLSSNTANGLMIAKKIIDKYKAKREDKG